MGNLNIAIMILYNIINERVEFRFEVFCFVLFFFLRGGGDSLKDAGISLQILAPKSYLLDF